MYISLYNIYIYIYIYILPSSVALPAPGCTPNGAAQLWEPSRQPETAHGPFGHWAGPRFLKCRESAWESMKSIRNISLVHKLSFSNEFSSWGEWPLTLCKTYIRGWNWWKLTCYELRTTGPVQKNSFQGFQRGSCMSKTKGSQKKKALPFSSWGCCVAVPPSDLSLEAAEEVLNRNLTSQQLVWLATAVSEFQKPCFVLMRPTDASLQVKIIHHLQQYISSGNLT